MSTQGRSAISRETLGRPGSGFPHAIRLSTISVSVSARSKRPRISVQTSPPIGARPRTTPALPSSIRKPTDETARSNASASTALSRRAVPHGSVILDTEPIMVGQPDKKTDGRRVRRVDVIDHLRSRCCCRVTGGVVAASVAAHAVQRVRRVRHRVCRRVRAERSFSDGAADAPRSRDTARAASN